jgi:imidazolonepropionase-like amidohydrolase
MTKTLLTLCAASVALAETIAITNARIVPVSAPTIASGTLLIENGRIAALGPKIAVPKNARKIDAAGMSVYPGWIDAWSSVGLTEISSVRGSVDQAEVGSFNPQAYTWVAVNPHSENLRTARTNGVTSALIAPSGGIVAGTASVMNLFGFDPRAMAIESHAGVVINPPQPPRPPRGPGGEAAGAAPQPDNLARLKDYLREAKAYAEMRARSGASAGTRDIALEALVPVMRGERPAILVANRFRDIRRAVELGDEFGLKVIIAGGQEAWKVADLLSKKNVGVLYSAVHALPLAPEDDYDVTFTTPEKLRRAGVKFAIASGTSNDVRNLPYRAGMAAAYGLEREDALKAITVWPAELLGVSKQVGSLEVGKLANLLVASGDPLDIRTEIKYVFVEGKSVPLGSRNSELYEKFLQK